MRTTLDGEQVPVYEIDGERFSSLEGFYDEISRVMLPGKPWGRNLDAFNDILRGNFGGIPVRFEFVWRNHTLSRDCLGHSETAHWLEERRDRGKDTASRADWETRIELARNGQGPTLYDWLVEILRDHGIGGSEQEDGVVLKLC